MMRYGMVIGAVVVLAAGCATSPERRETQRSGDTQVTATGFINKTLCGQDGRVLLRYVVYVPFEYTPERTWPMIVFLHGAGERGNGGLLQTEVGIGTAIRRDPERFPAIVLMPQCPEGRFWDLIVDEMDEAVDRTMREYRVDADRVYLTGLSMGGYGAWLWGGSDAARWAALMPVCGGGSELEIQFVSGEPITDAFGDMRGRIERLATLPIWAFHGADDEVVPAQASRRMVRMVRQAGGDVQYTEYPDVGHNAWDRAYADPEVIAWLFEQRRP